MKCICRETIFIYYVQKVANLATATKANKRQARTGGILQETFRDYLKSGTSACVAQRWLVLPSSVCVMSAETNQVIMQG